MLGLTPCTPSLRFIRIILRSTRFRFRFIRVVLHAWVLVRLQLQPRALHAMFHMHLHLRSNPFDIHIEVRATKLQEVVRVRVRHVGQHHILQEELQALPTVFDDLVPLVAELGPRERWDLDPRLFEY
eukprot:TRINITY_DN16474_c0_g1_i2.p2 TRINITY_DN16474_c0_g1~~TRINITY_DN16474_c0_g1_i2.p2  ORF type:complete len:127 (+),score=3.42 TRINITY_DN16474_c0_g1_i2:142-522(+)